MNTCSAWSNMLGSAEVWSLNFSYYYLLYKNEPMEKMVLVTIIEPIKNPREREEIWKGSTWDA